LYSAIFRLLSLHHWVSNASIDGLFAHGKPGHFRCGSILSTLQSATHSWFDLNSQKIKKQPVRAGNSVSIGLRSDGANPFKLRDNPSQPMDLD